MHSKARKLLPWRREGLNHISGLWTWKISFVCFSFHLPHQSNQFISVKGFRINSWYMLGIKLCARCYIIIYYYVLNVAWAYITLIYNDDLKGHSIRREDVLENTQLWYGPLKLVMGHAHSEMEAITTALNLALRSCTTFLGVSKLCSGFQRNWSVQISKENLVKRSKMMTKCALRPQKWKECDVRFLIAQH